MMWENASKNLINFKLRGEKSSKRTHVWIEFGRVWNSHTEEGISVVEAAAFLQTLIFVYSEAVVHILVSIEMYIYGPLCFRHCAYHCSANYSDFQAIAKMCSLIKYVSSLHVKTLEGSSKSCCNFSLGDYESYSKNSCFEKKVCLCCSFSAILPWPDSFMLCKWNVVKVIIVVVHYFLFLLLDF